MNALRTVRVAVLALVASALLAIALPAAPTAALAGPTRCRVPNVHGLTVARARPRLTAAGCRLGTVHPAAFKKTAVVIAESPEVGTPLPRGSKVSLFVRVQ